MNLSRPIAIMFMLVLICSACSKEKADFGIDCADYSFIVNDCQTEPGYTGSSIDASLCIEKENISRIKTLQAWFVFSSGTTSETYDLEEGAHFLYTNDSTRIFIPWCFYFDNSSYVNQYYRIITTDDKESEVFSLHIPRPAGAN